MAGIKYPDTSRIRYIAGELDTAATYIRYTADRMVRSVKEIQESLRNDSAVSGIDVPLSDEVIDSSLIAARDLSDHTRLFCSYLVDQCDDEDDLVTSIVYSSAMPHPDIFE